MKKLIQIKFSLSFRIVFLIFITSSAVVSTNDKKDLSKKQCRENQTQVVIMLDTSAKGSNEAFLERKKRIVSTIRKINEEKNEVCYLLIQPGQLLSNATFLNIDDILAQIAASQLQSTFDVSLVELMNFASKAFSANYFKSIMNRRAVQLVTDGNNNKDLLTDTLEAIAKLRKSGAKMFVIASGEGATDVQSLEGYVERRTSVYYNKSDQEKFFDEIKTIGLKNEPSFMSLPMTQHRACSSFSNKIELMILIDGGGLSIKSFLEQKQIASAVINAVHDAVRTNTNLKTKERVKVGIIEFSRNPSKICSLVNGTNRLNTLAFVQKIKPSGDNQTHISVAIDAGLEELEENGDVESMKLLVLISNGNGKDLWTTSHSSRFTRFKRKQNFAFYAISQESEVNFEALTFYTGSRERVFAKDMFNRSILTIKSDINECMKTLKSNPMSGKLSKFNDPNAILKNEDGVAIVVQKDELMSANSMEEEKPEAVRFRKRLEKNGKAKPKTLPEDCPTDVMFIFGASAAKHTKTFQQHVQIAFEIVKHIDDSDISTRKVRIGFVPARQKANVWSQSYSKQKLLEEIAQLELVSNATLQEDFKMATYAISATMRRTLIVVFWSENHTFDFDAKFNSSAHELFSIQNSELFIVSSSENTQIEQLNMLSPDKWHIYVDARKLKFPEQMHKILISCTLPPSKQKHLIRGSNTTQIELIDREPTNSLEKVERLEQIGKIISKPKDCNKDAVDLAILLDFRSLGKVGNNSALTNNDFESMRRIAMDSLKQAPAEDYQKRVRLSLLVVGSTPLKKHLLTQNVFDESEDAKTLLSMKTSIDRDDALFLIDRIELEEPEHKVTDNSSKNTTPLFSGMKATIENAVKFKRTLSRFIMVVISNGFEADIEPTVDQEFDAKRLEESKQVKEGLRRLNATVFFIDPSRPKTKTGSKRSDEQTQRLKSLLMTNAEDKEAILVFGGRSQILPFLNKLQKRVECKTFKRTNDELKIFNSTSFSNVRNFSTSGGKVFVRSAGLFASSSDEHQNSQEGFTTEKPRTDNEVDLVQVVAALAEHAINQKRKPHYSRSKGKTLTTILQTRAVTMTTKTTQTFDELPKASSTPLPRLDFNKTAITKEAKSGPKITLGLEENNFSEPKSAFFSDECKIDLFFVVDTSQSVIKEFQRQLQLAVDLVKRLPDDDFLNRVKIGAISFNKEAHTAFDFGELREKSTVLDALFAIKHTGGSTSVVSGLDLAVQKITSTRRRNARLMIVLLSDGKGQDPWERVVETAKNLRRLSADVYAVSVSHDYFLRELELYAGNKWLVYIDARVHQFLDEAETYLLECKNPSVPISSYSTTSTTIMNSFTSDSMSVLTATEENKCDESLVDLIFIMDTSTSVERDFYAEKNFALNLVRILPERYFDKRVAIALIKFHANASLQFEIGQERWQNDVLYAIERVQHTGGQTSLAAGANLAIEEIKARKRPQSRVVVVIISDGNSQDEWPTVQATAQRLKNASSEVYAVTLSNKYYFDELKEYTGNADRVYADERMDQFLLDVGKSVINCVARSNNTNVITLSPNAEISVTPPAPSTEDKIRPNSSLFFTTSSTMPSNVVVEIKEPNSHKELQNRSFGRSLHVPNVGIPLLSQQQTSLEEPFKRVEHRDSPPHASSPFHQSPSNNSYVAQQSFRNHTAISPGSNLSITTNFKSSSQIGLDEAVITEGLSHASNSSLARIPLRYKDNTPMSLRNSLLASAFSEDAISENFNNSTRCRYKKMDLIIILDASTSRETVFEHQRELALSLIERLPISRDSTHVATGVNSFTEIPTLRQSLGLGRERKIVRQAIEDIKYSGGSTLTSKAVELAVQDLERGRRSDAVPVVVLMNDGMSQDLWDKVLIASKHLEATGAERFGIALGQEVDLRELRLYVGNENRIYRDGSTERFLHDVVDLLGNETNCSLPAKALLFSNISQQNFSSLDSQAIIACQKPYLDLLVVIDNSDTTKDFEDSRFNSNRYLLLDILGSLPIGHRVNLGVFSMGQKKLELRFNDSQTREEVTSHVQAIQKDRENPAYAKTIQKAVEYYAKNRRTDARGLLLLIGNGKNATDTAEERSLAANMIRRTPGLNCYAVDSGKEVNVERIVAYTGSKERIYNYDQNAEFARLLSSEATIADRCPRAEQRASVLAAKSHDEVYLTPVIRKDIAEFTAFKSEQDESAVRMALNSIKHHSAVSPKTGSKFNRLRVRPSSRHLASMLSTTSQHQPTTSQFLASSFSATTNVTTKR